MTIRQVMNAKNSRAWIAALSVAGLVGCGTTGSPRNWFAKKDAPQAAVARAGIEPGSSDVDMSKKMKNPDRIHNAYAKLQEEQGNSGDARNHYKSALEKNPKSTDALLGLARLDVAAGRIEEAEENLGKAKKIAPKDPKIHVAAGQFYLSQKDLDSAIAEFRTATKLAPGSPTFEFHLGVGLTEAGDIDEALEHFAHAVGPAEAQYNVGFLLKEKGDLAGAEKHLRQAVAMKPQLKQAQTELASLRGGRPSANEAYASRGNRREDEMQTVSLPVVEPSSRVSPARHENDETSVQDEQWRNQQ